MTNALHILVAISASLALGCATVVPADDDTGRGSSQDSGGRDLSGLTDSGGLVDVVDSDALIGVDTDMADDGVTGTDSDAAVAPDTTPAPDVAAPDVGTTDVAVPSDTYDVLVTADTTDAGAAAFCSACSTDVECGAPARVRCTGLGLTQSVCLPVCIRDTDCPSEARCVTVTDSRGTAQVCAPRRLDACEVTSCATDRGNCNSDGSDGCEVDLYAAPRCGLCSIPSPAVGASCGECNTGTVTCSRTEGAQCTGASPGSTNACGGCAPLSGTRGQACGVCPGDTLTCAGTEALECGGGSCGPDLIVDNRTVTLSGSVSHNEVIVRNGGRIVVAPYTGAAGTGELRIRARRIFVDATSSIDASGAGGAGTSPGAGSSASDLPQNDSGAGGGYGGRGGNGRYDIMVGGASFGTSAGTDIYQGSNGGARECRTSGCAACFAGERVQGGRGGGLVVMEASVVELRGTIDASGSAGGPGANVLLGGGGGSGGGIYITADSATLAGTVRANGGAGGQGNGITDCTGYSGGGGGGGRIKVRATTLSNSASISANGGAAGGHTVSSGGRGDAGANGSVSVVP